MSQINFNNGRSTARKTETLVKQQKDAKHRMYVLDQWLKTQINYNEDIKASIQVIKPKMIDQKLLDASKANKLFPYFQQMLKMSDAIIEIISCYKREESFNIMIGEKLNRIVSYYKIYLEYFKHKTQIKVLYEELQKLWPKQLRGIESDLRAYFEQLYQEKAITKSKLAQQKVDNDKKNFTNPKANITIHDCLQRPLYRLFKYHLLIDSYLKKLSPKHPDYVPLKRAKQLFVQIGQKCNNSFTEQQNEDLKFKLQVLYGQSIPNSTKYKTMMTADSLYFPCKLYIFNNLIIVSKTQKMIGFRQEKLYLKLGIDEFSFISYKKDYKYFKNVLTLCGIYDCLHLILSDKGTRLQIYQLVSRIVHEQKFKAFQKRQHAMMEQSAKIPWMIEKMEKPNASWLTGIKFQVIDIDVRDLGMFSSDTVFIMSVSIPEYIDDEATFLKTSKYKQESTEQDNSSHVNYGQIVQKNQRQSLTKEEIVMTSKIGIVQYKKFECESQFVKTSYYSPINQHLEIHLDDLLGIYKELRNNFPQVKLPQIDPLSKDFNFYTQNKKKTKTFEVRSLLIQQFFNYVFRQLCQIFRHPMIMVNPMHIVKKIRLDQFMWEYVRIRSEYIQNDKRDQKLGYGQTPGNKYDQNHCSLCQQSIIDNITKFEQIREKMVKITQRKADNYCFNSYNLLRNNLLGLPFSQFNSVERMLLYLQHFQGRIDYSFMYKKNLAKVHKVINVYVPKLLSVEERNSLTPIFHTGLQIFVDQKTTVGMVVNSITQDTGVLNMFDFRLVIIFNGVERILDQDEYVYDIIEKYEMKWEEKKATESEIQFVGPRNSYRESIMQSTMGMLSYFKNILPSINKNESALYLKKLVYFPMYLELESVRTNFERSKIVVAQILSKISKSQSTMPPEVWGQVCGLYYCLLGSKELISTRASLNTDNQSVFNICSDLLPEDKRQQIKMTKVFEQKMYGIINQRKKYITSLNNQTQVNFLSSIHQRIIEIGFKHFRVNTYFTPVDAKRVPNVLVLDEGLIVSGNCYIGVNHNEIIVIRDKRNTTQTIRMSLEDVEFVHSVYSMFLSYRRENTRETLEKQGEHKIDEFELRFDSKTLHGFVQLCDKFKLMKNKFGPVLSQYENI